MKRDSRLMVEVGAAIGALLVCGLAIGAKPVPETVVNSVTAGAGLSGGGTGNVILQVVPCAAGSVLVATSTGWGCQTLSAPSTASAEIVDSAGTVVGPVVPSLSFTVGALYRTSTDRIKVLFERDTNGTLKLASMLPNSYLLYEAPYCAGTPHLYMWPSDYDGLKLETAGYSQNVVVMPFTAGPTIVRFTGNAYTKLWNSKRYPNGSCTSYSSISEQAIESTVEAPLSLTGPFKIK